MVNYEALWKIMSNLLVKLRGAGEEVPAQIIKDLRSAKVMIQILKVDPDNPQHQVKIQNLLQNVEAYLIDAARRRLGDEGMYVWLRRLEEAREHIEESTSPSSRFVPGAPRDKHWIRIRASNNLSVSKIKKLVMAEGLSYMIKDQCVLVYGGEEKVKGLIKRLADIQHGNVNVE